jgi:hypothetical protein
LQFLKLLRIGEDRVLAFFTAFLGTTTLYLASDGQDVEAVDGNCSTEDMGCHNTDSLVMTWPVSEEACADVPPGEENMSDDVSLPDCVSLADCVIFDLEAIGEIKDCLDVM